MTRFILRARAADEIWLFLSDFGPCLSPEHAVEYDATVVEQRRLTAEDLYGFGFEAVEVDA